MRENGGQYSHAAVWALMAQAARGNGDEAYRYFTYLSPAHRSRDPELSAAYAIEPYVMAGDIYSAPPYVGRGGWSWYTGSAAWMHRAAIESMFGLSQPGDEIAFQPCLPSHWMHADLMLTRAGKTCRVTFSRTPPPASAADAVNAVPRVLRIGERLRWSEVESDRRYLVLVGEGAAVDVRSPGTTVAEPG